MRHAIDSKGKRASLEVDFKELLKRAIDQCVAVYVENTILVMKCLRYEYPRIRRIRRISAASFCLELVDGRAYVSVKEIATALDNHGANEFLRCRLKVVAKQDDLRTWIVAKRDTALIAVSAA